MAGWTWVLWLESLMRIYFMLLTCPSLILAMAISTILRPNLTNALLAIAVTSWPVYARIARGQVLTLRTRDYVEAARAEGATDAAILTRHLIPNAVAPILVQATVDIGNIVLIPAGLSSSALAHAPTDAQ